MGSKKNTLLAGLIASLALFSATSCGEITSEAGIMNFTPATVDVSTASTGTGKQTLLLNVKGGGANLPLQGIPIRLFMVLHGRLPFSGASGVVSFLDADGNPLDIPAPDGSSDQGTVQTIKTDENGNISFAIQYPFGGDYEINITALGVRTSAEATVNVTVPSSS